MDMARRSRVIVSGLAAALFALLTSVLFLLVLASNLDLLGAKEPPEHVDDVVAASISFGIAALVIAVGLAGLGVVLRQRWCALFAALTFGVWALGVAWFLRWHIASDISWSGAEEKALLASNVWFVIGIGALVEGVVTHRVMARRGGEQSEDDPTPGAESHEVGA